MTTRLSLDESTADLLLSQLLLNKYKQFIDKISVQDKKMLTAQELVEFESLRMRQAATLILLQSLGVDLPIATIIDHDG